MIELNFAFWLSLVLAAAGCTGLILAGKGKWYGWGVGLAVQPVWALFAVVTKSYGLLLTCLMYGFVNAKNLWKWWKESHTLVNNGSPSIVGIYEKDFVKWKSEKDDYKEYVPLTIPCDYSPCSSKTAYLRSRGGIPSDYECPVCKTVYPLKEKNDRTIPSSEESGGRT